MFLCSRLTSVPLTFNKKVVESVACDIELNLASLPSDQAHLRSCFAPPGPRIVCMTCRCATKLGLCVDCFTQGQHEGHVWVLVSHSIAPCANGLLGMLHDQANIAAFIDAEMFLQTQIPRNCFMRLVFSTEMLLYHSHLSNNTLEVLDFISKYPIYHMVIAQVCCVKPAPISLAECSSSQGSSISTQNAIDKSYMLLVHLILQSLSDFSQLGDHSIDSTVRLHEFIKRGYSFLEFYVLSTHTRCLPLHPLAVDSRANLHTLYSVLASDSTSLPGFIFRLWPVIVFPLIFTTNDPMICRALLFDEDFYLALQSNYFSDLFYTLTREPYEGLVPLIIAYKISCQTVKRFTNWDLAHVQLIQCLLVRWIVLIIAGPDGRNSEFLSFYVNYISLFFTNSSSQQYLQTVHDNNNNVVLRSTRLEQLFFLVHEERRFHISTYIVSQLAKAIQTSAVLLPLENSIFYDSISPEVLDSVLLYAELVRLIVNKFTFIYRKVSGEHASAADPSRQSLALVVDKEQELFHPTLKAIYLIFLSSPINILDLMDTTCRLLLNQTLHGHSNLCSYIYNQKIKNPRGSAYPAIFLAAFHNAYEYSANYRTIAAAAQASDVVLDPLFLNRLKAWSALSEDGYALSGLRFPSLPLYSSLLHACLIKYLSASQENTVWSFSRDMYTRLLLRTDCFSWTFADTLIQQSMIAPEEVFDIVINQADSLFKVPQCEGTNVYNIDCQSERIASVLFLEILSNINNISLVYRMAFGAYARNGEEVTMVAISLISCHRPARVYIWHQHISVLQLLLSIMVSNAKYGSLESNLSAIHNPVNCCLLGILVSFGLISRGYNSLYTQSSDLFNQSYLPLLAIELDRRKFVTQSVDIISPIVDGELGNKHALHPEPSTLFVSLYESALMLLLQLIFIVNIPRLTRDNTYIRCLVAVYAALNRSMSPSSLIFELSEQFSNISAVSEAVELVCCPQKQGPGFSAEIKLTTSGWYALEPLLAPLELDRVHSAFTDSEAFQELRILPALISTQCNEELLDCFVGSKYFADLIFACIDLYNAEHLRHCCFLHLLRLLHCVAKRCVIANFLVPVTNVNQLLSCAHERIAFSARRLLFDPMAKILVEHIEENFNANQIAYSSMLQVQVPISLSIQPTVRATKRRSPQAIKIKMRRTLNKLMMDHRMTHMSSSRSTSKEQQSAKMDAILCCICLEPLSINSSLIYKTQLYALSELDVRLLSQLQAVPLQIIRSNFLYISFRKHAYQLGQAISHYPPRVWPELSVFSINPCTDNTSTHISHHSTGYTYLLDITGESVLIPYAEQLAEEEHASIIISVFTTSSTELFSLLSVSCTHIQHASCILRKDESEALEPLVCPVCSFPYITGLPLFRDILMQPSAFWSSSNHKMHNFILVELVFPLLIRILYAAHSSHGTKKFFPNTDELKTVLSSEPFLLGMILFLIHFMDCNLQSLLFLPKCREICREPSLPQLFIRVISDISRIFAVLLYLLRYIWIFDTRVGKKPFVQAVNECLAQLGERAVLSVCIIWEMAVAVSKELPQLGEHGTTLHMKDLSQCLTRALRKLINTLVSVGSIRNYIEATATPYSLLLACIEAAIYEALCPKQFSSTYVHTLKHNIERYLRGGQPLALDATFSAEACSFQTYVIRAVMKNITNVTPAILNPTTFNLLCPLALADTAFNRLKLACSTLGKNRLFLDSAQGKVCIYCGLPIHDEQEDLFAADKLVEDGFCRCWGDEFFESPFCGSRYMKLYEERYVLEPYEDRFGFTAPGGGCFLLLNSRRLSVQVLSLIYGGLLENSK